MCGRPALTFCGDFEQVLPRLRSRWIAALFCFHHLGVQYAGPAVKLLVQRAHAPELVKHLHSCVQLATCHNALQSNGSSIIIQYVHCGGPATRASGSANSVEESCSTVSLCRSPLAAGSHHCGLAAPQLDHAFEDFAVVVARCERRDGHDLWYCAELEDLGVPQALHVL